VVGFHPGYGKWLPPALRLSAGSLRIPSTCAAFMAGFRKRNVFGILACEMQIDEAWRGAGMSYTGPGAKALGKLALNGYRTSVSHQLALTR